MNSYELKKISAGNFLLSGVINKKTVSELWKNRQVLQANNDAISIDLTNITHSDSAGLALLICLQKEAVQSKIQITFVQIPDQLQQLIKLSHLQDILNARQGI